MPSFTDMTPEQLAEMHRRSAETRRANAVARRAARQAAPEETPPVVEPPSLTDLLPSPAPDGDEWEIDILTEEEKAEIRTAARKQIRKEARDKARKAFMTDELNAARRSAGAMPQSEEEERFLNEEVRLAIVMPRLRKPTGGEQEPEPIVLDGRVFVHGVTYTVKRSQAIYLLDVMDRNRRAVNAVDGRGSVYYHSGLGTMIHQGGIASGGGSMGMGFDALHKRAA